MAIKNKRESVIKSLVKNKDVNISQASAKYGTPLHMALIQFEHKNALRILKRMKGDVNRIDSDGNTPLHLVMKNFNQDPEKFRKIASILIKLGADLGFQNKI